MSLIEAAAGRFVGERYHLVRELGRGGMGVVWLARDLRRDMDVAIKFRVRVHHDGTVWLKREFRAVASLRHPNLVELYELYAYERSCYFTMEYLAGDSPQAWVHRARPGETGTSTRSLAVGSDVETRTVPPLQAAITEEAPKAAPPTARRVPSVDFDRLRAVLAQLAEGLAFLHGRGVIHRDIKPSNAIVSDGVVKLLDFGLALDRTRTENEIARETRVVGTAAYLAPEYVQRLAISPAMDLYALGVLAFELATGAPPFGGTLHLLAHTQRAIAMPRARGVNAEIPDDLDTLIADLLVADPALRPSALDVATRLTGESSRPVVTHRDAPFVGRAAELARLAARIDDPSARGRLVLVRGPSGAGKSALLDAAVRAVDPVTTLVWRGRCHDRERVPYRAFDVVVDDLATELEGDPSLVAAIPHVAALARVFPALADVLGEALSATPIDDVVPAADLRVERERALLAMTSLFSRVSRTPRGVLVIDDLQWADDDSLELLALLVEHVARPLTIVVSTTDDAGPQPGIAALLERVGRVPGAADVIALPAMTAAELAEMIAPLAPRVPITRLTAAAELAAGSPYLAELIGRELGDALELADARDAEGRRLARLSANERAVAEVVALAGGTASFEQLRAVGALSAERLQSALRGLEDARVVRATPSTTGDAVFAFYHQRLRDAAQAALAPADRRALHRRFAVWFDAVERGTDDSTRAAALSWHWQQAGEIALAKHWALAAAEAARAQLAWGVAAEWYGRALALGADPLIARAGRADAQFLAGKLAAAARELLVLAELDPPGADRYRIRAAEAYLKLGEIERGLALLDGVLASRGQPRARTRVGSTLRAAMVAARWLRPRRAPAQALEAVDDVLAGAYRVIASFLSTPYPIESFEYVLRAVALAERTGDHTAHSTGMAMIAGYLAAGTLGRMGDRAIAAAERLATDSGAPYARMVTAGAAGILATSRGDWAAMRTAHEHGERICQRLGLERSWEASFLRSYRALGELYAGEPTRALELLVEPTDASDDLFTRAMLGSFRGRALVVAGDLHAARALEAELERAPAARHGMAAIYRTVFAGERALAEHAWPRAREIAQGLARTARAQWLSTMPAIPAMVEVIEATAELGIAHERGDRAAATRARATARRLHRRGGSSFYAASALRLWAQAELALGDRARATALLARASTVAAERGGQVDRLAIAALVASPAQPMVAPGPLAAAVAWCTGGVVRIAPTRV